MIISMIHRATSEQVEYVCDKIKSFGYAAHPIRGKERVVIGAVGDGKDKDRIISVMESVPGVESVIPIMQPFKLVGSELKQERTVIRMDGFTIGGDQFVVMAGPCSVEYREQLMQTADSVKAAGAKILRGGAYKPRTSPYDFQGLEEEGLKLLAEARERTGLKIITEVVNTENVDLVNEYTDIFQVGARNMQNFALLKRLGRTRKPVLLKRGMMSTLKEFLMSAEYIVSQGNTDVILCERGIRTFETYTRNTLDHLRRTRPPAALPPAGGGGPQPRHRQTQPHCSRFQRGSGRGRPRSAGGGPPQAGGGLLRRTSVTTAE